MLYFLHIRVVTVMMEREDSLGHLDLLVKMVFQVLLVDLDLKGKLVFQDRMVHLVHLVLKVYLV